jgi:DNA-binding NtrC family response regulator
VVSATHRPLEKDVAEGRFRADLLARLGHEVRLPPLRERLDDVPLLVDHFLARYDRGRRRKGFAPDALRLLQGYRWPLNVRELQQVVERSVCLVDHDVIEAADLPEHVRSPAAAAGADPAPGPLRLAVEQAERSAILRALEHTRGNKRKAIELLKVSPETFYRRLEEYGLHKKGQD